MVIKKNTKNPKNKKRKQKQKEQNKTKQKNKTKENKNTDIKFMFRKFGFQKRRFNLIHKIYTDSINK